MEMGGVLLVALLTEREIWANCTIISILSRPDGPVTAVTSVPSIVTLGRFLVIDLLLH